METHFSYSKTEFKKYFGRKFRLANTLLVIAIILETVFGILSRNQTLILTSNQGRIFNVILGIFLMFTIALVLRCIALKKFAKESTLLYNNGMIRYMTLHSGGGGDIPYKYRHYYIDNIHNIVNEGEYLIIYGNIRMVDVTGSSVDEKHINKVKILKCFEELEDFLKEMGHMDSPNQ